MNDRRQSQTGRESYEFLSLNKKGKLIEGSKSGNYQSLKTTFKVLRSGDLHMTAVT